MEMESRYSLAQANLDDRRTQAAQARLVKHDRGLTRPVVVTGTTGTTVGLRAWLSGLRAAIRRPSTTAAASSAR